MGMRTRAELELLCPVLYLNTILFSSVTWNNMLDVTKGNILKIKHKCLIIFEFGVFLKKGLHWLQNKKQTNS